MVINGYVEGKAVILFLVYALVFCSLLVTLSSSILSLFFFFYFLFFLVKYRIQTYMFLVAVLKQMFIMKNIHDLRGTFVGGP